MPIDLKICGMNSEKIIQTIVKNGDCNYLGFVFYPPSPRNLTIEQSKIVSIPLIFETNGGLSINDNKSADSFLIFFSMKSKQP